MAPSVSGYEGGIKLRARIQITSLQNAQIKKVASLRDRKWRKKLGEFVVEGTREQEKALAFHYEVSEVYFCPSLLSEKGEELLSAVRDIPVYELNEPCFHKIVIRKNVDGIVFVMKTKTKKLEDFQIKKNPFLLLVEGIEKPGNLGALLRTADGAGVDGVMLVESQIDLYNPNVVRASLGCCFSLPIAVCTREEAYIFCKTHHIPIYAAVLSNASVFYDTLKYGSSSAVLLGSEDKGLDDFWVSHSTQLINIPMHGQADSLNVSAAGAILLYEISKQRFAKKI